MPAQELNEQNDERSPLLRQSGHPTPLPSGQLLALLLVMITEPLMAFSVMPYINEVRPSSLVWRQVQYPDIPVMMGPLSWLVNSQSQGVMKRKSVITQASS